MSLGTEPSQTMVHCVIDGGLPKTVQHQLNLNREQCEVTDPSLSDVALIRSVYRSAK